MEYILDHICACYLCVNYDHDASFGFMDVRDRWEEAVYEGWDEVE